MQNHWDTSRPHAQTTVTGRVPLVCLPSRGVPEGATAGTQRPPCGCRRGHGTSSSLSLAALSRPGASQPRGCMQDGSPPCSPRACRGGSLGREGGWAVRAACPPGLQTAGARACGVGGWDPVWVTVPEPGLGSGWDDPPAPPFMTRLASLGDGRSPGDTPCAVAAPTDPREGLSREGLGLSFYCFAHGLGCGEGFISTTAHGTAPVSWNLWPAPDSD